MLDEAQRQMERARAARNSGDLTAALSGYRAAVASLRGIDAPLRLAHTLRHVADLERQTGDLPAAKANYAEALDLYRSNLATGVLDLANTLRGYALLMERLGNPEAAQSMWQEARMLYAAVTVQAGMDEADRRLSALIEPQT